MSDLVGALTQQQLKSVVVYDNKTGLFTWTRNASPGLVGKIAGHISGGYRVIKIHGKHYRAHHLAWLYVHGELPTLLDHINGKPDDNRIENLRIATIRQNVANSRKPESNTSGAKGVRIVGNGKFKATVTSYGQKHDLGTYNTLEEAKQAYLKGAEARFGEFAHNGDRSAPTHRKRKVGPLDSQWIRNAGVNDSVTPMYPGQEVSTLGNVRKRVLGKILAPARFEEKRKEAIARAIKSLPAKHRDKLKADGID